MNDKIFYFFYNLSHQSFFFDQVIIFFAVYIIFLLIIAAFLFLFLRRTRWQDYMSLCISGGLAWILAKILKILFNTPRPFDVFPKVQSLFVETGQAFPSGHTMVASAIAFTVFSIHKRVGYIFMGLAVLVGLSRIISGVHFPIDILGGFIFGALVANFVKNR